MEVVETGRSGIALFVRKMMGPSAWLRRAARINGRFNRTKDVVVGRKEPEQVLHGRNDRDGF